MLDVAAGTIAFGIAANQTRDDAGMLQVLLGGAAPGVGERHFAFPSDCLPWPTRQGLFVIEKEIRPEDRSAAREDLANEWKSLDVEYVRGVRTGHARWAPGCPAHSPLEGWAVIAC